MAINTFTSIKSQLQAWLETTESTFVATIDEIIRLGELKVQRDLDLEDFKKNATGNLTGSSRTLAKPSDYIKAGSIMLTVSGSYVPLLKRSKEFVDFYAPAAATESQPKYWSTDDADNLYLAPTPDTTYAYTLRYLARLPALTETSQEENWLTENVPDLLFYACIAEAQRFLDDPSEADPYVEAYYTEKLPAAEQQYLGESRTRYHRMRPTPKEEPRA